MGSEDGNPEELRIVLFGASGSGKSATGNTILRKRAFTTRQYEDTETLTCKRERGEFEGTPVSVVDTPGTIRQNSTEKSKYISYCAPGPHAFLLVITLEKITDVERQVKSLQWTFGEKASRYSIVLFTHGDELPDGVTTEQFIHQNPLSDGLGFHVFNNRDEDPSQIRELLEKINRMVQRNGGSYRIKAKDWKDKYLYPFTNAVTIGGAIGAASGGTAGGALMALVGSCVGAMAVTRGNRAVAKAVVGSVSGAVGAGLLTVTVVGFIALSLIVPLSFPCCAVISVRSEAYAAGCGAVFGAGAGVVAAFVAVVAPEAGAADMGLADALRTGVALGAGIAVKAAAAIFAGADTAGPVFEMFDDIYDRGLHLAAIWGVIGGAAVGAGVYAAVRVSAAVGVYGDGLAFDLIGAGYAVVIGVSMVYIPLSSIIPEAGRAINNIVVYVLFAGVSVGAGFGAAAGSLGASGFAGGAILTIVCKAVTWWLNRKG